MTALTAAGRRREGGSFGQTTVQCVLQGAARPREMRSNAPAKIRRRREGERRAPADLSVPPQPRTRPAHPPRGSCTLAADRAVMHEHVRAAVVLGDEAVALVAAEPLHGSRGSAPVSVYLTGSSDGV